MAAAVDLPGVRYYNHVWTSGNPRGGDMKHDTNGVIRLVIEGMPDNKKVLADIERIAK